jgi:cystathionine beta-lyase/cystathionine gamma-synthase
MLACHYRSEAAMTVPGTWSVDTLAVHAGRDDCAALGVHAPPIDLSSTAPLPSVEAGGAAYEQLAAGGLPRPGDSTVYRRLWNPTVARFEAAVAALEGAEQAVAFGSGMAALSACLLSAVADGRPHVVAVRPLYGGSDHLLATGLLGTSTTWTTPDGVGRARRPDTGLVLLETPANPTLDLVDIEAVVQAAGGVPVLVDNTFATPVLQQPLRHGAALVLHSATKFLGGHGDALGGVVATDAARAAALRRVRAVTGGLLDPFSAYLLHRGLPTLPVRVRAQQATAEKLAAGIVGHPALARVLHPSLPGLDPLGLVGRQLAGPGSVLAVELAAGFPAAAAVAESLRVATHAVSLGGVDTLVQHPAALTHRPVAAAARPGEGLLRISVGLEDPEDLLADLRGALDACAQPSTGTRMPV